MDKKKIQNYFINIVPIVVGIPFLIILFGPLELYFNNQQEFWFDFYTLIPSLFCFFLILSIINLIFLCVLVRLGKVYYTVGVSAEFIIFIYLYIQGNFFVKNLPALDGSEIDWASYKMDALLGIIVLIVIACVTVIFVRILKEKICNYLKNGFLFVELVLAVTLITVAVTSDGLEKKQSYTVTQKNIFEMSTQENFLILLLDALDSETFFDVLSEHPEYFTEFSDFTYYPDTMAGYPYTTRSIPFILSGKWFENKEPFEDYLSDIYRNSEFLGELEETGYKLGLYEETLQGDESIYRFENVSNENKLSSRWQLAVKEMKLALFKYMPYFAKPLFYFDTKEFNSLKDSVDNEVPFTSDNLAFYNALNTQELQLTNDKCFRFIHIEGAHVPFQYDEEMNVIENGTYKQNIEASMTIAKRYLEKLKEYNVYDNSVVIIMADHGYSTKYRQSPLFMVKGRNEQKNSLSISNTPISYKDLLSIYHQLIIGDKGEDIVASHNESRRFLYYVYLAEEYMSEYVQTGHAWNDETMIKTGNIYNAEMKTQEVRSIEYFSDFEKVDTKSEVHVDLVSYSKNGEDNSLQKDQLDIYGWAKDTIHDKKAKEIYAEVNGKLYKAEATFRDDLFAWKEHYGWCGFKVTVPNNISDTVKIYIVTEEDQVLLPHEVDISEYFTK